MAKKVQKYYVVWQGKKTGIFDNWNECLEQVSGFQGAQFKAFVNKSIAEKAFKGDPKKYFSETYNEQVEIGLLFPSRKEEMPIQDSLSVDAACSGNPGVLEYQGVSTKTKKPIFHQGPFPLGTVNIGEFLAIVHGLAYLKRIGSDIPLYSDSETALTWLRRKSINTKLERTTETEQLFQLVDRAIVWLKSNQWNNPVLKWKTEIWGEIPADFGRK
jgi:ribonuclease HI